MTKDEALAFDLALRAFVRAERDGYWSRDTAIAVEAIKQARSAPVQEPACRYPRCSCNSKDFCDPKRQQALDKKAENARELGLNYEPPCKTGSQCTSKCQQCVVQEPVAGQPLPCPFCGHIGLDFGDGETYRWGIASCGGCGASCTDVRREYPDQGQWHTEAIAEWNKRSPAAQRQWVGLTTAGVEEIALNHVTEVSECCKAIREAEAKLRKENT